MRKLLGTYNRVIRDKDLLETNESKQQNDWPYAILTHS